MVPAGDGPMSASAPADTISKGTGRDRAIRKILEEASGMDVEPCLHASEMELDEALSIHHCSMYLG